MKLIIGGAFQNKKTYVIQNYKIPENKITDGCSCEFSEAVNAVCIGNYHMLVKRLINAGTDPIKFTENLCAENSDLIIIMDEIGCGIIPIERSERLWRETVGKCGCIIAEKASRVTRITCGIPAVIKENGHEN